MKKQDEGFTLIELLIVIVILGILAAVVVFAVNGITDRGQSNACDTDERTMRTAAEAYFADNQTYGGAAQALAAGSFTTSEGITINAGGSAEVGGRKGAKTFPSLEAARAYMATAEYRDAKRMITSLKIHAR